ncbi:hypothetical protein EV368DRAFT_69952, partial [Lentinula lateritia]
MGRSKPTGKAARAAVAWLKDKTGVFVSQKSTKKSPKSASSPRTSSILPTQPEPFTVPAGFVKDGTKLAFSGTRDRYLPAIFEVPFHSRIPEELRPEINRILVIPWPINDPAYNKFYFHYVKENVKIPGGRSATIPALGWGKLISGDILFVRDIHGAGDDKDDSFEAYAYQPEKHSDLSKILNQLRDETLGSRNERTRMGSTKFEECANRAIPVGGEGSCFSVGFGYQKPRNLAGPSVGGKVRGDISQKEKEHLQIRQNIVTRCVRAGVDIFKQILPQEYKILEQTCELHNVPCVGTDDNVCFTGVQTNIARPKSEETDVGCIEELLFFGGIHFDQWDSEGSYTQIISNPDIPTDDGWEGGRFHLVEFGVFVELNGPTMVTFTGLRLHGGTPLLAPTGVEIPPWAYRWVVVLYPQAALLDGRVSMNISVDSNGIPMQLTPEMHDVTARASKSFDSDSDSKLDYEPPNALVDGILTSANEINFIDDSALIVPPQARIDFLARSFFLHTLYHQKRICPGMCGNFEQYRQDWYIQDSENMIKYCAHPWLLAPDNPQLLNHRQKAHLQWIEHCNKRKQIIPSASRSYKLSPITIPLPRHIVLPPKTRNVILAAQKASHKKALAKSRKERKSKKAHRTSTFEIIGAAHQAPQVLNFDPAKQMNNMKKRKRQSLSENEDPSSEVEDECFEVERF